MVRKPRPIQPTASYSGLGFCIYCKTQSEKLNKEHVVPYSMGGYIVLLGASCKSCEKITSKIERSITKGYFDNFRNAMNFPTRRPSRRQDIITGKRPNSEGPVNLPWFKYPAILSLPILEEPGIIAGRQPIAPMKIRFSTLELHDNREPGITIEESFVIDDWLKYIAKICHSAAYCLLGPKCETYQQFLPRVIRGSESQMYYVGGIWDEQKKDSPDILTDIDGTIKFEKKFSADGREALLVYYKPVLYADMPTYIAVFGQKKIGLLPMEPMTLRDPV